ncbi:MAG: CDP-glycerol glycerophosphotransferase family protein, partial [Actinomycetota bacterium]|nr:CDP-glycerol glycerophosphotransferase family protein [Actinomycetota bacterium]
MTQATPTPARLSRLKRFTGMAGPQVVNRLVRKSAVAPRLEYRAWVRSLPIEPDVVLYESFAGNGMLCNPEAIFRELHGDPQMQRLTHVWVLNGVRAHRETMRAFKGDGRVRFVERGTLAYYRAVATAGVLINNATFPADVAKRPGQIYLNTWHGTPLKAMGYHEPEGAYGAANTVRNFLMADYLLSTSTYMSEVMYEGAYRLGNIAVGERVETGYPRTDHQFISAEAQRSVRRRLRSQGVTIGVQETMVLYAPTWK